MLPSGSLAYDPSTWLGRAVAHLARSTPNLDTITIVISALRNSADELGYDTAHAVAKRFVRMVGCTATANRVWKSPTKRYGLGLIWYKAEQAGWESGADYQRDLAILHAELAEAVPEHEMDYQDRLALPVS